MAAVRSEDEYGGTPENVDITLFFQDTQTPQIYMSHFTPKDGWDLVGMLEGLEPAPKPNSSIAAVRMPGGDKVCIRTLPRFEYPNSAKSLH